MSMWTPCSALAVAPCRPSQCLDQKYSCCLQLFAAPYSRFGQLDLDDSPVIDVFQLAQPEKQIALPRLPRLRCASAAAFCWKASILKWSAMMAPEHGQRQLNGLLSLRLIHLGTILDYFGTIYFGIFWYPNSLVYPEVRLAQ